MDVVTSSEFRDMLSEVFHEKLEVAVSRHGKVFMVVFPIDRFEGGEFNVAGWERVKAKWPHLSTPEIIRTLIQNEIQRTLGNNTKENKLDDILGAVEDIKRGVERLNRAIGTREEDYGEGEGEEKEI